MVALPAHARLFTSDSTVMYTNIEPAVGIAMVKAWLSDYESELPKGFPSWIIIEALELVMTLGKSLLGTICAPHVPAYM
jgi:hypothetical protein